MCTSMGPRRPRHHFSYLTPAPTAVRVNTSEAYTMLTPTYARCVGSNIPRSLYYSVDMPKLVFTHKCHTVTSYIVLSPSADGYYKIT